MSSIPYQRLPSRHNPPLTAIIIGAGLGGCAAAIALHHHGHTVLCILDKARTFTRLGDSLGLGENAFSLLQKWGCNVDEIKRIGNQAPTMTIRRWHDGKPLATQPLMDMAGLVVGAADAPVPSAYACFRAFFQPSAAQRADPALNAYLRGGDSVNFWVGEDVHLVQNTLRGGDEFNWIITHKDEGDVPESWFQEGDMESVRRLVGTLDPDIRGIVGATEKCLDWKICYREPLGSWVAPGGHRIVLLGDSCHAHLPTSAQGASQAVESAGVLGVCLNAVDKRAEVRVATRVYEKVRFARTRASQRNGEDLRERWHGVWKVGEEIDPEMVKIRNRWLYDFDAEEDARTRWEEVRRVVEEEFAGGGIKPLC